MTSVNVQAGVDSSHDISLDDGNGNKYGLIYASGGVSALQEMPMSPPARPFTVDQKSWLGGRGRVTYKEDPTGFNDSSFLWSTSDELLAPALQVRWADGLRNHNTYMLDDNQDYTWWSLYAGGNTRYLSTSFAASASYTTGYIYLHLRRVGSPGTLTVELSPDNAGDPGVASDTITKVASDLPDTTETIVSFAVTEALTGSSTYHIKIYGAGTDDSSNYWQVLCNDDGSTSKSSTDDATWSAANVSMYFRVIDNETLNQKFYFFELQSALYCVKSYNDQSTASELFINGVRGTATAGSTTTLTDSNLSMTADQYIGAYIRIIDGTGDSLVMEITDNDATSFTFADCGVTLDTTSVYVVYGTDYWTEITSTGLGHVVSQPAVADKIVYFPQGATTLRRMRVNASSHDFANDVTDDISHIYVHTETTSPRIYMAGLRGADIKSSSTKSWGTNLAWGGGTYIGTTDFRINKLIGHQGKLHILKEDGAYTFYNNVVTKLGSNFDDVSDPNNGKGAGVKNGYLWMGWADSIVKMTGSSIKDMMNFKLGYEGSGADRRGFVSSVVSGIGWLFLSIQGDANNYSSILVHNDYGWHEIYRTWEKGQKISEMTWQSNPGAAPRLWFHVDGQIKYIEYPLRASRPTKDSTQNYMPEGVLITSTIDGNDPRLYKMISDMRVYLKQGTCKIDYQTNQNIGVSWTSLSEVSSFPSDVTLDLGAVLRIRFRFRLQSTHSRTPCILEGYQVTGRIMPTSKFQWVATFRVDSEADTYFDEPDHNPTTLHAQLLTWAQQQTKLTLRSTVNTADNKVVTISLPTKGVQWVDGSGWGGRITLAMLET